MPDPFDFVTPYAPHIRIAHQIPGRVRFKFDAIVLDDPQLKRLDPASVQNALAGLHGVKSIHLNPLARSCVVEYDSDVIPDSAWSDALAGRRTTSAEILSNIAAEKYRQIAHAQLR
ncbi:MAG TPA: cation transporter [Rhodocyclaceae bacterium]|nr:cation transporter [Rhodocyclaceae bacterium]